MADYSGTIALAKRLLAQFGETSTLVRAAAGVPPDPTKPWAAGPAVSVSYPVSAAWLAESILVRDVLVKTGEVYAILAASDLPGVTPDPATDQIVRADGRRYAVIDVRPLNPAGDPIIYEVRAKS